MTTFLKNFINGNTVTHRMKTKQITTKKQNNKMLNDDTEKYLSSSTTIAIMYFVVVILKIFMQCVVFEK